MRTAERRKLFFIFLSVLDLPLREIGWLVDRRIFLGAPKPVAEISVGQALLFHAKEN
jgi:hypothetical protein